MRETLLCAAAMAGASLLMSAAAAAAEKPTLEMSGYLRFGAASVDQDLDATTRDVGFEMDDIEIHFDGSATADNGLEFGFHVELTEGDDGAAGPVYDVASIYLSGDWGRVELGSTPGVEDVFKVGAVAVMADLDGAWDGTLNFSDGGTAAYIGSNMQGNTGDSNKINYYTPEIAGFSGGISFVPSSGDEMNSGLADNRQDDGVNVTEAAIKYAATLSAVDVEVSARGVAGDFGANETGDPATEKKAIRAWGVGARVAHAGFEVAGSYSDNGDTGVTKAEAAGGADAGAWWDVGVAYGAGPCKVSVAYMRSWAAQGTGIQDDEIDYLSIGGVYAAAPGLDLYASYQYVDLDQAGTDGDNQASMVLVGTQVSF